MIAALSIALTGVVALNVAHAFPAPAVSTKGMAATAHPLATEAALEILDAGGNAVDAAVAATFAISVTSPFDAGLGGGGFAMIHLAGKDGGASTMEALDFREVAPKAATRDMYLDKAAATQPPPVKAGLSTDGPLAVAVPGTVAGLYELHKKHGVLPWRRVVRPAIAYARDGFAVGADFVDSLSDRREVIDRFPSSRDVFVMKRTAHGERVPLEAGDRFKQPDLARTLEEIARNPRSFYEGPLATAIVESLASAGGIITLEDLKAYQVRWRAPLCAAQKNGLTLCTMPPPSSGGVHVIEILNLMGDADLAAMGWHSPDALHLMIESMRIAYADRAVHLGDPAFTPVPVSALMSRGYADERRKEIDPKRARKSADVRAASPDVLKRHESNSTSHLSVVDAQHNAVALTFTVNTGFGSGFVAAGTGIVMNNEMDDFAAAPGVPNSFGLIGAEANSIQPGKIPLSSMTPLIVTKDGKLFMTAGAPGGGTIITTVLQTYLGVAAYGMDCAAAVAAPRVHQQWQPEQTRIEVFGLDDMTKKELEARGHVFRATSGWGNAMCIRVRPDGALEGGADPRGEGVARGP